MSTKPDSPVHVLLVEGNPGDARLIRELLRDVREPRFDLEVVGRLSAALDRLQAGRIDAILLDLWLPDSRGIETLRKLLIAVGALPVVALTGKADDPAAIKSLQIGAHDVVSKDRLDRFALVRAIRFALARSRASVAPGIAHPSQTAHRKSQIAHGTEELYRALCEAAADFVWVCRPDGAISYVNRRWQQYTGLTLEQVTVDQWEALNHPDDLPTLRSAWQTATASGQPFETEFRYRGQDSVYRWFWGRAMPLKDGQGKIVNWVGAATDITRRKQAELDTQARNDEERRLSDERYRSLLDTAQEGVWVLDADGTTSYVNRRMAGLLGCAPEEMLGRSLFDYMDDRARTDARVYFALRKHGLREQRDFCFRRKDGSALWTICSTSPLLDRAGEPAGILCMITDITERKQAEEALREASQRLKFHVENSPLAVIEWDPEFRITRWTDEAQRIFGYSEEEVLGKRIDEFNWIFDDDWPDVHQMADHMLDGSRPRSVVSSRCCRKDGTVIHCDFYNSALMGLSGKLVSVLSLVLDVTERKRAEDELRKAKHAAESATAAKSAFLATMSHEIRTPLNGVVGMVDMLLGTRLDDRQRRYAQIIKASATTLAGLINDILDFSKIEANRLELEDISFDLNSLVEDLIETFVQRAAQKRLELVCHLHPQLPEGVRGDAAKLRQVLSNLIGNALKFTEQGHVIVEGSLESETEQASIVRFTVTDTGPGIPSDHLGRLFQPFYQVDASTTRRFGGSGLGLAISKRLVEMMGGQITVQSEPGRGSSFSFTVCFARQASPKGESMLSRIPAHLAGARILVVDHSAVGRRVFQGLLSDWGLAVQTVPDSRQAMEALNEAAALNRPYDLVLLPHDMSDVSGLELARAIKGTETLSQAALILLISMEQTADAAQLRQLGVAGSIVRPVRASRLLDVITQALPPDDRAQSGAARAAQPAPDCPRPRTRILLAEDNEINQVVAAEILMRYGYQCQVVSSGKQAVEAVSQSHYDLLLMDCQMPQMDGFEATQVIRQQERDSAAVGNPPTHLPIIALTAEAVKGDRERCLQAGMDAYIAKPIDSKRLIAAIESFIGPPEHPAPEPPPAVPNRDLAPPIDTTALLAHCMGNRQLAHQVLSTFSRDADRYLDQMRQSLVQRDVQELARAAHSLKGAAGYVSASMLIQIAAKLEHIQLNDLDRAKELLKRLADELRRCLACIPGALVMFAESAESQTQEQES